MQSVVKKRIGILRGGAGEHYASSLKKGGDIISHITENLADKYKPVDILIDKKGVWHMSGVPITPANLIHNIDVAWNTLRPSVSMILENFSIPYVGTSSFTHTLGNSREMLREHLAQIGVSMPRHIFSPKSAREVLEKFPAPWRVGDKLVKTFPELVNAIEDGLNHEKNPNVKSESRPERRDILVEEFIAGKVASVHSIPHFRKKEIYIFPPVNVFGSLTPPEKEKLVNLAKDLHHHLGVKHYLKSNFLLNKRGKIFLLDFESMPNLKLFSHFSQACDSVGAKMHQVVEHILEQV